VIVIGCDPGIHGGIAAVSVDDGAAPQLVDAVDIPIAGTGAKERVDVIAIRNWIERSIEAVVACCAIPVRLRVCEIVVPRHAPCPRAGATIPVQGQHRASITNEFGISLPS
jgi:hypothetical protein